MQNFIKNKKFIIASFVAILFCLILAQGVIAGDDKSFFGLKKTAEKGFGEDAINNGIPSDITGSIGKIISAGLSFVGVIFLILIIYGGFLWMTARDNEQTVKKAKDLIVASIIGLIIVLSAYAISYFVIGNIGGKTLNYTPT